MTTMASDYGSSSSSDELDDELFHRYVDESYVDESDTPSFSSSSGDDVLADADSAPRDSPRSSTPDQEVPTPVAMTARAYQLEMLEESLKGNIIVAVGWTPKLRMARPADRCDQRWTLEVERPRCKCPQRRLCPGPC
jgi:hypothetical protein